MSQEESHVIQIRGRAHDHMMYLDDYDHLDIDTESLTIEQPPELIASGMLLCANT